MDDELNIPANWVVQSEDNRRYRFCDQLSWSGVIVNVGVKVGFLVSVRSPIDDVACVAVGKG